jgi:hypothetical protein
MNPFFINNGFTIHGKILQNRRPKMNEQLSRHQEGEVDGMGIAIMGFSMGALAIGGIWFALNFLWEVVKMLG